MINKEHQSLFDEIAQAAAVFLEGDDALANTESLLTEWWSLGIVKNIHTPGVKKELIESLAYFTNEK